MDEPKPQLSPGTTSATAAPGSESDAASSPTSTGGTKLDPRLRGRCVRPLPATPQRTSTREPDPRCPEDPEPERAPLPKRGKVIFLDADLTLEVELAERYEDRMRGLMFRRSLSDQEGMLFLFAQRMDHRFWMRNTCVSLDMLYIDADGLIVGVEENVPTLNDDTYSVGCPSQYVLEVPAGWCRRHGVEPGQFVRFRR